MVFYVFASLLQQVTANINGGGVAKFCDKLLALRGFEQFVNGGKGLIKG